MTENRCRRCNRVLKDPNAQYGWKCAEILGVSDSLNYAGDHSFLAYVAGVNAAKEIMRKYNIDPDQIDLRKFYDALSLIHI